VSLPTEYSVNVLPHDEEVVSTRIFNSNKVDDLVAAVTWMIESLPTEMQRASARVGIMLTLRHEESA
jgi:hypothetical protein